MTSFDHRRCVKAKYTTFGWSDGEIQVSSIFKDLVTTANQIKELNCEQNNNLTSGVIMVNVQKQY